MGDSGIIFDQTIQRMQDRLSLNSLKQDLISGNMANMNTPGYKAKETSFDQALRDSLKEGALHLVRSSSKHEDPADADSAMESVHVVETGPVDLDSEMVKLANNSVEYQFIVGMLNKKLGMLRQAIEG